MSESGTGQGSRPNLRHKFGKVIIPGRQAHRITHSGGCSSPFASQDSDFRTLDDFAAGHGIWFHPAGFVPRDLNAIKMQAMRYANLSKDGVSFRPAIAALHTAHEMRGIALAPCDRFMRAFRFRVIFWGFKAWGLMDCCTRHYLGEFGEEAVTKIRGV